MTNTIKEKLRILLVDDHPVVRKGLALFLQTQPDMEVIGEASRGEEAVALVEAQTPDLVLMDLILPGIGGVEATRRIKALSPGTIVVALTSSQERDHVLPVLSAGASAYLLKDVGPSQLVATLRRAVAGEVFIEPRVAAQLVTALQKGESSPTPRPLADLTAREVEVLRLIAQGLNNIEVAKRLFVSDKTIKTHVSNILSKLQLADRTQAAVLAWKTGLMGDV